MTVEEQALQLSRSDKLKLMESLWSDLSQDDQAFDSPAWHEKELAATERRRANGEEPVLDWEKAKDQLRGE